MDDDDEFQFDIKTEHVKALVAICFDAQHNFQMLSTTCSNYSNYSLNPPILRKKINFDHLLHISDKDIANSFSLLKIENDLK